MTTKCIIRFNDFPATLQSLGEESVRGFSAIPATGNAGKPLLFEPESNAQQTYVYVIAGGSHCKVGITTNLKKRLCKLQNGNPHKLIVAWSVPVPPDRATLVEGAAHSLLKADHAKAKNEWFKVRPEAATRAVVAAARQILKIPLAEAVPTGPCGKYAFRDERRSLVSPLVKIGGRS